MLKYFALSFIIASQLNVQSQTSPRCFSDFNLYKNEGRGVLDNCHASYFVKCFTNSIGNYRLITNNVFGNENDYIKTYQKEYIKIEKIDSSYIYIFPVEKEPLEGRLFRNQNDKRFDTLLSKNDTLYFKKAYPHSIQVSKYFRLVKDTICIVSFYYNDKVHSKSNLTFQNINEWGSDEKYSKYEILKLKINDDSCRFVSKINSDKTRELEDLDYLNEIIHRLKVPPSLFWVCIIFRFLV